MPPESRAQGASAYIPWYYSRSLQITENSGTVMLRARIRSSKEIETKRGLFVFVRVGGDGALHYAVHETQFMDSVSFIRGYINTLLG
jgi:S-formylglutathione hydrolase FrmB